MAETTRIEPAPTSEVDEVEERLRQALVVDLDAGFADVVRVHEQVVYSVALRLTRRPPDAEDLAAEAFLRAYRALGGGARHPPPAQSFVIVVGAVPPPPDLGEGGVRSHRERLRGALADELTLVKRLVGRLGSASSDESYGGPGVSDTALTSDDIRGTYDKIKPYLRRTPIIEVEASALIETASARAVTLVLKLEQMQNAGSFKARGAFANLLLREVPASGVVAASGGNHGVAVAYAAARLGVPAKIFVPTICSPTKIESSRALGAGLVLVGDRYADALDAAQGWAKTSGALSVHTFDQRETLLGQATLGLELAEQAAELDTVQVPVGGGGLIGGIAAHRPLPTPAR